MFRFALLFITSLFLFSCYATVNSNVTSFSKIGSTDLRKTVAVMATNKELNSSLQFEEYKMKVEQHLRTKNFRVINDPSKAQLIALLNYGIDTGKNETNTVTLPTYGQTGVSGSSTFGSVNTYGNYGTFSGTTTYYPTYGITGYQNYTSSSTMYTRVVQLDIFEAFKSDTDDPKKLYESKVVSRGTCSSIDGVIDEILSSLFRDFPNSFTGTISEEYTGSC